MTEDDRGEAEPFVAGTGATDRKADAKRRLGAALRANLRRRKASPDQGARAADGDHATERDRATDRDRG